MTDLPPSGAPSDAMLARYLAGAASEGERALIEAWVSADAKHREMLAELRAVWDAAGAVPTDAELREARQSVLSRIGASAGPSLQLVRRSITPPRPVRRFAEEASRRGRAWRVAGTVAAIAAGLVIAVVGGRTAWRHPSVATGLPFTEYTTKPAERATVTLLDGTRVVLAPASRMRVSMRDDGGPRDVSLDGEAMFAVEHDAARPFTVHTTTSETRDIGTAFDVRAYPGDAGTRVVVREGRVALRGGGTGGVSSDSTLLDAGELGRTSETGALETVSRVSADSYVGWISGRLVFDYTPLREALPEIGRWYGLEMRLADSTLADRRISATFTTESPTQVLAMLATLLGVRFERTGNVVTVRR
jgi:transmembrane sensor